MDEKTREEQIEQLKRTVDQCVHTAAEALHALKLLGVTEYVRYVDIGSQAACRAELAEELGSLVRVTAGLPAALEEREACAQVLLRWALTQGNEDGEETYEQRLGRELAALVRQRS